MDDESEKELPRGKTTQEVLDMFARIDVIEDELKPTQAEIDEAVQQARQEIYGERHNVKDERIEAP